MPDFPQINTFLLYILLLNLLGSMKTPYPTYQTWVKTLGQRFKEKWNIMWMRQSKNLNKQHFHRRPTEDFWVGSVGNLHKGVKFRIAIDREKTQCAILLSL